MNPPSLLKPTPMPMIGNQPAWREILRRCKWPTDVVLIDFETFRSTDYSLSKMSTVEYVTDPRYEELAKGIYHTTQPFAAFDPVCWRGDYPAYITYLQSEYGRNLEGCTVVGHNLPFDGLILALKYGIVPTHAIDILGLARHENARAKNGVEDLAKRFGLPPKGETVEFKDIHLNRKVVPGCPPTILPGITDAQWTNLADYTNRDLEIEWGAFIRLLPRLSRPEFELRIMQHTLEMFWKPSFTLNAGRAAEMTKKMEEEIDKAVIVTGTTREEISGTNSFTALLDTALTEAGDELKNYQKPGAIDKKTGEPKMNLAIAKDDEELPRLKKHASERVRQLMNARISVKSWPLHIGRVESLVRQAGARGGMLGVPLKYHGAHTGRWAGDDDINLQNLPSRSENELLNSIRTLIEALPDQELVIADQSAIEARVLAWIAGQEDLCQLFRDGSEVYCTYASKMIGDRPLRKPKKTDPPLLAKFYKRMRDMGKVQVLGGGYGMGWEKCIDFAATTYKTVLTEEEARNLIDTYRKSVPMITMFWRLIEQAFKKTARYHHPSEVRGIKIHYEEAGDLTVMTLPNGRTLKYAGVRVSIDGMREQMWMPHPMTHAKIFLWGGTLTENAVQAMARDILAEWILNTEEAGYHVALTVHDEIISPVAKGRGEKALKEIIRIGSLAPAWAPGCPLGVEGKVSDRYEK